MYLKGLKVLHILKFYIIFLTNIFELDALSALFHGLRQTRTDHLSSLMHL